MGLEPYKNFDNCDGAAQGSIQEAFEHWETNKILYKRKELIDF